MNLPTVTEQVVNESLRAVAASLSLDFFDPVRALCSADGCLAVERGAPLFWDTGHLTAEGSARVASALLAEAPQLFRFDDAGGPEDLAAPAPVASPR